MMGTQVFTVLEPIDFKYTTSLAYIHYMKILHNLLLEQVRSQKSPIHPNRRDFPPILSKLDR
jgi:hypothetical protein